MFTASEHPELIARLNAAQGALHRPIDIVTFAYFKDVTKEQVEQHVAYYEEVVAAQPVRKTRRSAR